MKRFGSLLCAVVLSSMVCYAQSAAPAAAGTKGAFPVKITKALDSSKLKDGDSIEVETAGSFKLPDGTLVPKGSHLTGRVTAAKARSKGDSDSQLTMSFDKLNIMNGKQLAIKGTVQAVFPPADEPHDPLMAGAASGAAGGSVTGGAGVGGASVGTVTNGKPDSSNPQIAVDAKSTGVQGMHDLELSDGVLSSKGKNVKLGNGVRMIVRVDILG
jgi:hypothetical protein